MTDDLIQAVENIEEKRTSSQNKVANIPRSIKIILILIAGFATYLYGTRIISIKTLILFALVIIIGAAFSTKEKQNEFRLLLQPEINTIFWRDMFNANLMQRFFPHGFPEGEIKMDNIRLIKDPVTYQPEYYNVGFYIINLEDDYTRWFLAQVYPYTDNPGILGIRELKERYKGDDDKLIYKYVAVGELDKWRFGHQSKI